MHKCVVVIPIYKSNPSDAELQSFSQCLQVLNKYPIRVLIPRGLNTANYSAAENNFSIIEIDEKWLSSIEQYNLLKRDLYFYNLFSEYDFLLTYELDAFVFRDELNKWAEYGYDYIGAPWFENFGSATMEAQITGVGNSGFSLRNIAASIRILKRIKKISSFRKKWSLFKLHRLFLFEKFLSLFSRKYCIKNLKAISVLSDTTHIHEDFFWCKLITDAFTDYNVSGIHHAIKFSFEVNPSTLYKMNNYELPFGCHAWEKYEPGFWDQFINNMEA